MTSSNIKKVQIIAEIDDGTILISQSDKRALIAIIAELCQFQRIDKEKVCKLQLKQIIDKGGNNA